MERKIVMLSGGLDSVVLAYKLKSDGADVRAIHVNFGYLTSGGELFSAKYTANKLNIPLEIVQVEGLADMLAGFYPPTILRFNELDTGSKTPIESDLDNKSVSGYYVLLSIASLYTQLCGYEYLDFAILKEQVDNRPGINSFITQFNESIVSLNTKQLILEAPFKNYNKSHVVELGNTLGVNLSNTWSCNNISGINQGIHCGVCSGCTSRKKAFREAGILDETIYIE